MKTSTVFHLALRLMTILLILCCLLPAPQQVQAQNDEFPETFEKYNREELAQMLAPIALYPDSLLSQVLMAATYPIEVIEADRWAKNNPGLAGDSLDTALLDKDWDPSVKAICHFPSVLSLMSERIAETTDIGNAFLAQEAEVMKTVQDLRAGAHAQGNLVTNAQQKIIVEKETIIIEPADPKVIYVPYYDPNYVFGPWWWYPDYPPYYWGPAGSSIGYGISYWPGFYFGFTFGTWSYFDWHRHYIYIDVHKRPRFVRHDHWLTKPGRWHHLPSHRRGVAYRDKTTARKYGQSPSRRVYVRPDSRGFPEQRENVRRNTERSRIPTEDKRRTDRIRIDTQRQERERIEPGRREGEQADRIKLDRQRTAAEKQKPEAADRNRQTRQAPERIQQERSKASPDRERKEPAENRSMNRENIFNPVENGWTERQSSERGRFSRENQGGVRRNDQSERYRTR